MSHPSILNQTNSKLLIYEPPLQILPSLAIKIGLNEAIVLQQIHYWISNPLNKNIVDGRKWVYNTYDEWGVQFPFWSKNTIIRTIESLESKKLIVSNSFNKLFRDRTKWYTIDYDNVNSLNIGIDENESINIEKFDKGIYPNRDNGFTQDEYLDLPKLGSSQLPNLGNCDLPKLGSSSTRDYLPETISKITTETNIVRLSDIDKKFEEFWDCYDNKKGKEKCYKIYAKLLENKGVKLHNNIINAIKAQKMERESADSLGLWQPARKMPMTWLNGYCWEDQVKTQEQLDEERQREIIKLSRKPKSMSKIDQYHYNQDRIQENARELLIRNMQEEARERGEVWEWDGSDSSLGLIDF